jgi:hypothetical protein
LGEGDLDQRTPSCKYVGWTGLVLRAHDEDVANSLILYLGVLPENRF